MRYAYLKLAPFKLAFTVISGKPVATVTLTSNSSYKTVLEVSESNDYMVPYEGPGSIGENVYQSNSFIIEVSCSENCSYSMLADSSDIPRRLAEGFPYKLIVDPKTEKCVQFLSLEGAQSTHVVLSSNDISKINYTVSCYERFAWQRCNSTEGLILKTVRDNQNINLKLRSLSIIYVICMKTTGSISNATITQSTHLAYRTIP